jgi:hypothetical protein
VGVGVGVEVGLRLRLRRSTEKLADPLPRAAESTSESRSTLTTSASKTLAGSLDHSRSPRPDTLNTSSRLKAIVKAVEKCSSVATRLSGIPYHETHLGRSK